MSIDKDTIIDTLWANSNHGTRREDVVAIWDAAYQRGLEDAAKLADHHGDYWSGQSAVVLHRCADAIRSLKESTNG